MIKNILIFIRRRSIKFGFAFVHVAEQEAKLSIGIKIFSGQYINRFGVTENKTCSMFVRNTKHKGTRSTKSSIII